MKAAHLQHFPTQTSLLRSWSLAASGGVCGGWEGLFKTGKGLCPSQHHPLQNRRHLYAIFFASIKAERQQLKSTSPSQTLPRSPFPNSPTIFPPSSLTPCLPKFACRASHLPCLTPSEGWWRGVSPSLTHRGGSPSSTSTRGDRQLTFTEHSDCSEHGSAPHTLSQLNHPSLQPHEKARVQSFTDSKTPTCFSQLDVPEMGLHLTTSSSSPS